MTINSPSEAARVLFPDDSPYLSPVEDTGGIVQRLTLDSGATYILKCFDSDQGSMVEREIGMRKILQKFTDIRYPDILDIVEVDQARYLLMNCIEGDRLDRCWQGDPSLVPLEVSRLGAMLGKIHDIPLAPAAQLLAEDAAIYTSAHFSRMQSAVAPFLSPAECEALSRCFALVTSTTLEQTVVHADFGPHQIIVEPDGSWVLFDFEFSMVGPFADDLAGAEVRMERVGFRETEAFLSAYHQVRSRLAAYQPVRGAFKTYLLLVIISTAILRDGEDPLDSDLKLLRQLIRDVA